jgi:hypothetical protein
MVRYLLLFGGEILQVSFNLKFHFYLEHKFLLPIKEEYPGLPGGGGLIISFSPQTPEYPVL